MATTIQRVDKDTFQPRQPRYQDRHGQAVIGKLLGCGTPESGYTTYLYPHCLERTSDSLSQKMDIRSAHAESLLKETGL
jgi:hypothetical protein